MYRNSARSQTVTRGVDPGDPRGSNKNAEGLAVFPASVGPGVHDVLPAVLYDEGADLRRKGKECVTAHAHVRWELEAGIQS
jgi:hypothetical protein